MVAPRRRGGRRVAAQIGAKDNASRASSECGGGSGGYGFEGGARGFARGGGDRMRGRRGHVSEWNYLCARGARKLRHAYSQRSERYRAICDRLARRLQK